MSDVLCVMPKMPGQAGQYPQLTPPLGLASIAAVLEEKGISVTILDLQIDDNLLDVFNKERPKLVCISGSTETRFECFDIARLCKEKDERVIVAYGGPHATFTAEDTLKAVDHIDIVGRGEGEYTVLELARTILDGHVGKIGNIEGISYRSKGGEIVHNPRRERIRDLDNLPLPARHLLRMDKYNTIMEIIGIPGESVVTSRGCPIGCSFCSASRLWGRWYTMRSPSNVMDEIELLIDNYGVRGIKFFDSTLTLSRKHIEGLCDAMLDRGLDIVWECEVRADTADKDLFAKMKKAGCYLIDIGIESGNPSVLKRINKKITVEQALQAVDWAKECGLQTKVFLTWGHPGETVKEASDTIKMMKKLRDRVDVLYTPKPIKIYPGTAVEQFAREHGFLEEGFSWSGKYHCEQNLSLSVTPHVPLLIQPGFGYDEITKLEEQIPLQVYPYKISLGYVWCLLVKIRSKDQAIKFVVKSIRKTYWLLIWGFGVLKKWVSAFLRKRIQFGKIRREPK